MPRLRLRRPRVLEAITGYIWGCWCTYHYPPRLLNSTVITAYKKRISASTFHRHFCYCYAPSGPWRLSLLYPMLRPLKKCQRNMLKIWWYWRFKMWLTTKDQFMSCNGMYHLTVTSVWTSFLSKTYLSFTEQTVISAYTCTLHACSQKLLNVCQKK